MTGNWTAGGPYGCGCFEGMRCSTSAFDAAEGAPERLVVGESGQVRVGIRRVPPVPVRSRLEGQNVTEAEVSSASISEPTFQPQEIDWMKILAREKHRAPIARSCGAAETTVC